MNGNVAASTQNQALNALLFLYREILKVELPWLDSLQRAKKPARLPVVLTRDEVRRLLANLDGTTWLIVALIYGAVAREGYRLSLQTTHYPGCQGPERSCDNTTRIIDRSAATPA